MLASTSKPESKPRREQLREFLAEAVEETMKTVLGEIGAEAIFRYMETEFSMVRILAAHRLEAFHKVLERTLGVEATLPFERSISEALYRKLHLPFKLTPDYNLADYVREAEAYV